MMNLVTSSAVEIRLVMFGDGGSQWISTMANPIAADLARSMVAEYGMSEALGPVAFKGRNRQRFLEVPGLEPEPFAEETARQIDSEIKQLVVEAHARASDILRDRRNMLSALARRLMEQEVVEGAEVRALIERASSSAPQAA